MNLDHLKYLTAVDTYGSVREAGRQLLLKPQYISNVIKSLEQHYGVQIFERVAYGMVPTENGRYLIDKARQILALIEEMESDFLYPGNKEQLVDECTISVCIPGFLDITRMLNTFDKFTEYFPKTNIVTISKTVKDMGSYLRDTDNSIAVFATNLSVQEITQDIGADLMVVTSESVPLTLLAAASNQEAQTLESTSIDHALRKNLVFLAPNGLNHNPVYQSISAFGKPNVSYIVDLPSLLLRLMEKQGCYTIAKKNVAFRDKVIEIPFEKPLYLNVNLIYHPDRLRSYAAQKFLGFLEHRAWELVD